MANTRLSTNIAQRTSAKYWLGLAISILALSGCHSSPQAAESTVTILNDSEPTYSVELAQTIDEQRQGLMFRESLPENEGMLFIYNDAKPRSFWMKNTLIPLDIIYINSDQEIVDIKADTPPCQADPCTSYPSSQPAQYVLEINGDQSEQQQIKVGDKVQVSIEPEN